MINQIVERLLAENPGLTRENAVLIAETERIIKLQELEHLEHYLIIVENANRYDASLIDQIETRISVLRRAVS